MSEPRIDLLTMPKWGLAMHEGSITHWLKAEGDQVTQGEPVCEIETSKISNELDSPFTGKLARIVQPDGNVVHVGDMIAVITSGPVDPADITALLERRRAEAAADLKKDAAPDLARIAIGDGHLAYLQTGPDSAERAVLLLHGFGGDHGNWGLLQAEIPAGIRAIAVDLPGHGASDCLVGDGSASALAERLAEFIQALGLRQVDLVGHSFGGRVALRLAAAWPGLVASLLLIAPAALGAVVDPAYLRGFLAAERKRDMKPVMEMLFSDPAMVGRTMVNDALRLLRDEDTRHALDLIADNLRTDQTGDPREDFSLLNEMASIVVWGDADRVVTMPQTLPERIVEIVRVVPGVGHMPHVEKPGMVASWLHDLTRQ